MKARVLVCLLIIAAFEGFSQQSNVSRHPAFFSYSDSNKISFSTTGVAFFKNNEYFNPLEEGYTLPGSFLQPALVAQVSPQVKISAGAGLLKYSGMEHYASVQPFFRLQYQPTPWFQMVLGNLFGGSLHKLDEPLYRWERDFTHPMESGLQFFFDRKHWNADIWLNWENFIQHNDPFQEILSVGISSEYIYNPTASAWHFSSPVQALFRHHGGQINAVDLPIETLSNCATGFSAVKNTSSQTIPSYGVKFLVFGFNDFSPQKLQEFKSGYAFYPSGQLKVLDFTIQGGYFYGKHYISALGEKLFHCGKIPDILGSNELKSLAVFKILYSKNISETIQLGAYFESYSDTRNSFFDYDYGVHVRFNPSFLLLKYRAGGN